jgi:hypothetical protein
MPELKLDINQPQEVRYCVPEWYRDANIRYAIANVKDRIQPGERREEPIAVVGFGPSLTDTWEQIKQFKYVMTCSGSHKFLLERGIVPTWHVEVDPREHKIALLGQPHPDVEYLVASACNPKYIDHLAGHKVKIWHVYDPKDEGIRLLPPAEWAVTGGCDVGLRALAISAFLGFRDVHVFGLDGSARGEERHAAEHPYGKQKFMPLELNGKTFYTTPGMLEAARQTVHELRQLPAVKFTFYGEGLTQELTKGYQPNTEEPARPMENLIAFAKPELISSEYRALNAQLHRENVAYGVSGEKYAKIILDLSKSLKTKNILDYGCGKGLLGKAIPWAIAEYDPAIPGKEESPKPADIVACTDVLEHIEPDKLEFVLDDLRRCVRLVGFFVIHTGPAMKTLPDGRNTHLIQKGKAWWSKRLRKHFKVGRIWEVGPELYVIVGPKC